MNIKIILKENEITLAEFAKKLSISRPTLNDYIKQYEECKKISNDKYQIVFEQLFSKQLDSETFNDTLQKYSRMIDRDKRYEILDCDVKSTDLANNIIDSMKEDLRTLDHENNIYKFIQLLIWSYKNDDFLKSIADYFLILSAQENPEEIGLKKKVLFSNLYKIMKEYDKGSLEYDSENYKELVQVYKNGAEKETEKIKEKEEEINNYIKEIIGQKIKEGIPIDKINLDEILSDLAKRTRI